MAILAAVVIVGSIGILLIVGGGILAVRNRQQPNSPLACKLSLLDQPPGLIQILIPA